MVGLCVSKYCCNLFLQNQMHLHELATGLRVMTFPLDIGSVVGYSGKKKDKEVSVLVVCNLPAVMLIL